MLNLFSANLENFWLQTKLSCYYTTILPHPRSAESARAEEEDTPVPSAGNTLDFVKAICQPTVSNLLEEVQAELKLLREKIIELHYNTTKFIDHISARLESLESTVPSTMVADEVAQLRNDVNAILERHNALLNETDLFLSRLVERLAPLEWKNDTASVSASGRTRRRQSAKKSGYPSDTNSALLLKTHLRQILDKKLVSVVEPHNMDDTSQHTSGDRKVLDILDSRNFFPPTRCMLKNCRTAPAK